MATKVTTKKPLFGNRRSHSLRATRHAQLPNLQNRKNSTIVVLDKIYAFFSDIALTKFWYLIIIFQWLRKTIHFYRLQFVFFFIDESVQYNYSIKF